MLEYDANSTERNTEEPFHELLDPTPSSRFSNNAATGTRVPRDSHIPLDGATLRAFDHGTHIVVAARKRPGELSLSLVFADG